MISQPFAQMLASGFGTSALVFAHCGAITVAGTRSPPSRCVPASQPSISTATWAPTSP
jgi:hypothetical protein